ncbi:hypothetical protein B9G39_29640 [Zooshikella ganghwensis]|uniref:Uncharacterized protein n=1 Tax=Zooshikella ganghwensis TaxID=202772 RepID=A0A4P9VG10_9GAMM|nr:hypothetical protein B9G39_29640 [Zooshikella ganghwensis]
MGDHLFDHIKVFNEVRRIVETCRIKGFKCCEVNTEPDDWQWLKVADNVGLTCLRSYALTLPARAPFLASRAGLVRFD